jgi:Cd2+/Zn2+-exporting ATPase
LGFFDCDADRPDTFARRAISAARASTPFSIEVLTSIAAVGAVIISATEQAG